jgi:tyrosinase
MHLPSLSAVVLALAGTIQAAALQPRDLLQDLQDQAMKNLEEAEANGTLEKRSCTLKNAGVRQDWYRLPCQLQH